jgi:hypothetical protein
VQLHEEVTMTSQFSTEPGPQAEVKPEEPASEAQHQVREAPSAAGAVEPEATVGEELAKQPYEPFLPVEAKLVAWSLALGLVLLGLLVWLSSTFFAR